MKFRIVLGIALVVLLASSLMSTWIVQQAIAVEPPSTEWDRTYGGVDYDRALAVVQTSDGGYAIAGETDFWGPNWDFWLVKTDSAGNHVWNQTYGGTDKECACSLVQTGDGGYALAGSTNSSGAGGDDFWLVKTDASGNHVWNQTYGGTSYEMGFSLVHTSDGGYAIAGSILLNWLHYDFWLVKTDAFGNHVWNQTYGGTDYERAVSLVQTGDGGYAIVGETNSFGAGSRDFWLVKVAGSPQSPVGGIHIPIDKLALLAPYIASAALTIAVAAGTVYARKHWLRKTVAQ